MIKKILISLLGILIVLILVGFLLPRQIEVRRSITINAPAEFAFEEIDELQNWDRWSYWNTLDPEMKITFANLHKGKGGSYSWDGPEVGKGKITITESQPFESITCNLDFMEQGTAKSWYYFDSTGDQHTELTMGFSSDFGMNPIGRWMGVTLLRSEMNKAFDYSLKKIKELAEAKTVRQN